jgi:hypothetical protein
MPLILPCRRRRFDAVFIPFASSFVFFRQPFAFIRLFVRRLLLAGRITMDSGQLVRAC